MNRTFNSLRGASAAAVMLAALPLAGCATAPRAGEQVAAINHVVFIKLKDPARTDELLQACRDKIITIPTVATHYLGTHYDIGRDGIDADYNVGLYVGFDNEDDYRAYLDHPDHLAAVEEWSKHWEWIRIYDIGAK